MTTRDASQPWHLGHDANPYFAFTDRCNGERPEIILASGQACVWYRLTLASKDGDWIVRENEASLSLVRQRLADLGACYRLGAPLDVRWLRAGWSSHCEAVTPEGMRLRFDFVSRPPRVPAERLARLWQTIEQGTPALVDRATLILLKQTMRLKDYAFIGSLALQLPDLEDQVRWSIDADHLIQILATHPSLHARVADLRPAMHGIPLERDPISAAIDADIRRQRQQDEVRMQRYVVAMQPYARRFRSLDDAELPVQIAHDRLCAMAADCLPQDLT